MIIGMISYLPDDIEKRTHRFEMLNKLIDTCNYIFRLPIYIVIQNYHQDEIDKLKQKKNVILSKNYDKLGIVNARKTLREYFINSNYNNLIMLDDDCEITGGVEAGKLYLQQINENKDCFIEFNDALLKLFCISKSIFKEVDYADIHPEKGEGFEDTLFVVKLRKLYPDKRRIFIKNGLEEHSLSGNDKYSTWYTGQDIVRMAICSLKN